MKIKAAIEKIPGGMMVIPLILGAIIKTRFPEFLKIGGFTTAIAATFGLGCGINLETIYKAGFSGILLGLLTVVVCGFFTILMDKVSGGFGVAGAANASHSRQCRRHTGGGCYAASSRCGNYNCFTGSGFNSLCGKKKQLKQSHGARKLFYENETDQRQCVVICCAHP